MVDRCPICRAFRRGTLKGAPHVRTLSGGEFEVRPVKSAKLVTADGEVSGRAPAHFRIVPKALSVYVAGLRRASSL